MLPLPISKLTIIAGYYGVGKTNFALNLARIAADATASTKPETSTAAAAIKKSAVTLIDLDVVNPYFRSSDYASLLDAIGVKLIAPALAGTTIESPALSAKVNAALQSDNTVIIDVGGDDAGATALARYHTDIERRLARDGAAPDRTASQADQPSWDLWFMVNLRRMQNAGNTKSTVTEALAQLRAIKGASGMRVTGIVNNTHLQDETTTADIAQGLQFARAVADAAQLPLVVSTYPASLTTQVLADPELSPLVASGQLIPVEQLVKAPWQH